MSLIGGAGRRSNWRRRNPWVWGNLEHGPKPPTLARRHSSPSPGKPARLPVKVAAMPSLAHLPLRVSDTRAARRRPPWRRQGRCSCRVSVVDGWAAYLAWDGGGCLVCGDDVGILLMCGRVCVLLFLLFCLLLLYAQVVCWIVLFRSSCNEFLVIAVAGRWRHDPEIMSSA